MTDQKISYIAGDDLLKKLESLMSVSEEILVAMAFVSAGGVQKLADRLRPILEKRKISLRVILDRNFAPTSYLRKLVLDQLKDIGADVRILETPAMMHTKLYIFRSGSSLSAVCGSGNLTNAGFEHNVELNNLVIDLPNEPKRQLSDWFEEFWLKATKITQANLEDILKPPFHSGCVVTVPALEKCGVIVDPPTGQPSNKDFYWVKFSPHELIEVKAEFLQLSRNFTLSKTVSLLISYRALSEYSDIISIVEASRIIFYPHQVAPILSALSSDRSGRVLVADEVGLGKTITAAIFIAGLIVKKSIRSVLIICPGGGLESKWRYELSLRFGLPFEAPSKEQLVGMIESGFDPALKYYHIVSHELLRANISLSKLSKYQLVVIDEIHKGRNQTTNNYQALSNVSANANFLLGLSATPLQTSSSDLESIINIVDPIAANQSISLQERVALCRASRKLLIQPNDEGFENLRREVIKLKVPSLMLEKIQSIACSIDNIETLSKELNELCSLGGRVFRTTKKDLGLRIPRNIHNIFVALNRDKEKEYFDGKQRFVGRSSFGGLMWERLYLSNEIAATRKMAYLSDLSASNSDVDSWDDTSDLSVDSDILSRKEKKLLKVLNFLKSQGRKAIIFCGFVATSRRIGNIVQQNGFHADQMDGHTFVEVRHQYIKNLQAGRSDFLVSTSIGQEGLDMQFMDTIINYDLPWNPMVLEQRIGRVDRLGQKAKEIHIYNFFVYAISKKIETVDQRLMKILLRRLLEVNLHLGEMAPILEMKDIRSNEEDALVRSIGALKYVNEWLPGLKISNLGDINQFSQQFEKSLLKGDWIQNFVGLLAPSFFPGTTVNSCQHFIIIKPTRAFLAAAQKHNIGRLMQFSLNLIEDSWFCTTDRMKANDIPEFLYLVPQHPIVRALAELYVKSLEAGERINIPQTSFSFENSNGQLKISYDNGSRDSDKNNQATYYDALASYKDTINGGPSE